MTPINDPNLISQLEGSSSGQAVTDPNLIAQLEGTQVNPSLMNAAQVASTFSGMPAGIGLGALNSLTSFGNDVANLLPALGRAIGKPNLFPQGQLPQLPQNLNAQNLPGYGVGKFIGNVAPFVGGGELLDAARGLTAASNIPGISGVANTLGESGFLPTLERQAIGGGVYGGITNQQDPGRNAAMGTALSSGLSLIPGIGGKIAQGFNYLKPGDFADQIVNQLSGGQSLEQSGKNLASAIKNNFETHRNFASENYFNPVENQVGTQSIYSYLPSLPTGVGTSYRAQPGLYESIPDDITNTFSSKVKQLNNIFSKDQSFSNAHELQQQLGNEIGALQYKSQTTGLDDVEQTKLENYANARTALKTDMNNFLTNTNPQLANLWNTGVDYYRNNVVPYYSDSNIMAMAKGKETNPTISSITSSFKNPNPDIQSVVNNLPDQAKNSLLYTKLGTTGATSSPENLVKYFDSLDQQGMGSYVPQSLADQINSLRTRIKARNIAQGAAGSGLAFTFLHPFSHLVSPEVVGAATLGSGFLGPMLARMGQRMLPDAGMPALSLGNLFPAVRAAVIPNVVGGQ